MASKEDLVENLVPELEAIGIKVSKANAWNAFKACMNAAVATTLADEGNALSLSGVGKFEVLKAQPRSSKIGLVEFVPRLRFRPSVRITERIEEAMGQVPDEKKMAAAKEKLRAEGKGGPFAAKADAGAGKAESSKSKKDKSKKDKSKKAEPKDSPEPDSAKGDDFEDEF